MTNNQSDIHVKQDDIEMALNAPALDEDLFVNLDPDVPTFDLSTNIDVRYLDAGDRDDDLDVQFSTASVMAYTPPRRARHTPVRSAR